MFQGFFPGINNAVFDHDFSGCHQLMEQVEDAAAVFGSDEFRMFAYKIQRCPRTRSHDWTECPYAHRGEKAQRRDLRRFNYSAVACPAFRNGNCPRGDFCEYAHGVFEYWLHPARYRTRACNAGRFCQRKVCFFAHTPEQLRSETKQKFHFNAHRTRVPVVAVEAPLESKNDDVSNIVNGLKGLTVREIRERKNDRNFGWEVSDSDLPHIGWICELLQ